MRIASPYSKQILTVPKVLKTSVLFLTIVCLLGCVHLISHYDEISYKHLTDLKAETLLAIDQLLDDSDYENNRKRLESLLLNTEKAYQYEAGKKKNEDTIAQLQEIKLIINRLVTQMKKQGSASTAYINNKKEIILAAFDKAIMTESSKLKYQ